MKKPYTRENHTKQKDFYHTIAEASFAGIYVVQDGRFSYLNRNAASYAGYTPIELVGRDAFSIVHHEDRDLVDKLAREMLKGLRTEPYEFRIITKDLQTRWIMETVISITYQGKPAILGNSMDVTEKKQAEAVFSEQKMRYQTLFEGANDAIFVMEDYVFTDCNNRALEVFKCKRENLVGATPDRFSTPLQSDGASSREKSRERMDAALRGEPQLFEWLHCRYDGTPFYAEVSLSRLDIAGKVLLQGIVRDIDEKKRTEEALSLSENRYRTLIETTHDLVFTVDRWGYFTYINPQFQKTLGYTTTDLLGKPFTTIVVSEGLKTVLEHFKAGIKGGIIPPYEVELLRKDGKRLLVEFLTTTIWDGQKGKGIGRFGIGRDITERRHAEDLRRESEKRLTDMIDFLPDATLAIDREGRVIAWNRAIEDMTGISKEKMIGKDDYEYAIPLYGLRRPILIDLVLHPDADADDEYSFIHRVGNNLIAEPAAPTTIAGKKLYLWAKASPLFDTQGGIIGAIESIRDITNIKQAEQDLKESESNYRKIFDESVVGMFQSTPEGRFVHVNPALAKMCGFTSPEEMIESVTDMAAQHYVYSDDREYFKETIKKQGFVENFEHATFRKDGTIFWVSVNARLVLDNSGKALHYEGTHIDITDRKLAQDALKASEERYRAIIENIGDGYYEVDLKGHVQFMNDSCARITGVPHHKLIGVNFKEFAVEEDEGELYRIFHRVFMTGEPEKGLVTRVNRPDGKEQYVEISVSLQKDSKGKPTGFMGILHDVTERRKAEETIQWMAYHDALTGLPNRILFHDRLAVALIQAKRNREQLAVMMLDLDKFKEINDSYGHYMGDCILCAFVECVKKQLREGDTVARMGGDEFMILLPGIRKIEDLEKLGQKIIEAFQVPVEVGERSFVIRTSLGIALYPRDGQDFDTLVKKADMAMYQAKKLGGNKYIICC
ncbi:MAG: PAS domain S-box protein [Deltaproteobacteria bacterium]|nr:PAS domain S-box protein [Deltaproteobacteria bacterium]